MTLELDKTAGPTNVNCNDSLHGSHLSERILIDQSGAGGNPFASLVTGHAFGLVMAKGTVPVFLLLAVLKHFGPVLNDSSPFCSLNWDQP
jgi:hypothetical protein